MKLLFLFSVCQNQCACWQVNIVAKILQVRARQAGGSNGDWALISNSLFWISKTQTCVSQVSVSALLALAYICARLTLCKLNHIVYLQSLASILFKPLNSQNSVPAFLTHCLKTCSSSPNWVARAAKFEASLGLLCMPVLPKAALLFVAFWHQGGLLPWYFPILPYP